MRRAVEVAFEARTGGEAMVPWMWRQRSAGLSLRAIADSLSHLAGIPVSHESVRRWMVDG
jgi:transposase-like protein